MTKIYSKDRIEYTSDLGYRHVWRDGDIVRKTSNFCLDTTWRDKFSQISEQWDLPAFRFFCGSGYATSFIDGPDLHGNPPFTKDKHQGCILDSTQKLQVIDIFAMARNVGCVLGYTLGDITCGNMLLWNGDIALIDYEVIVPYPLSDTYINIWNNTLRIVFG